MENAYRFNGSIRGSEEARDNVPSAGTPPAESCHVFRSIHPIGSRVTVAIAPPEITLEKSMVFVLAPRLPEIQGYSRGSLTAVPWRVCCGAGDFENVLKRASSELFPLRTVGFCFFCFEKELCFGSFDLNAVKMGDHIALGHSVTL